MKKYLLLSVFLVLECTDKKPESSVQQENNSTATTSVQKELKADSTDKRLNAWINYYKIQSPDFALEKFETSPVQKINYQETNTKARFDEGFDRIYEPFLVYSPNQKKYIDFDSYNWFIATDGNLGFEADQEVILVNLPEKTKHRIAFFGPSYRIEAAYWKNDDEAVLLGNGDEKLPFFIEYNFKNNESQYFQYTDTLQFKSDYRNLRLQEFGMKTN